MTLTINITYDTSVTDLKNTDPTLYTDYTGAVQAAVDYYETTFTNPITVNMSFGWGEVAGGPISAGAIGESSTFSFDFNYAQLLAAVKASETTSAVQLTAAATLPNTDPTGGATFAVATSEATALGLNTSYAGPDGSVGLDSSQNYSWTQSNVAPGTYDAVGVLEHEISEVLGREDDAGQSNTYTLLDMFRYTSANGLAGDAPGSAAGARDEPFVAGYSANAYSYFSYDGSTVTQQYDIPSQVASGADVADWAQTVQNDSYGYSHAGQQSLVSPTDLQEMNVLGYDLATNVACYLPDTRITTPSGDVPVQNLVVGDMVLTNSGDIRPVTWIGNGKVLATRGRRNAATPIIIRKGALGDNIPNRDLRITKGHSLYLDGVLIPAEYLVNHRSITWDDRAREVTVYHVELAVHDVLLANGAPAESYRDDGNRWLFQNNNTGWDQPSKAPCAPVLTGGPVVDAIWRRLLDRSGPRPGLPVTNDPDLYLSVDGNRIDGVRRPNGAHTFRLSPQSTAVRIVSRAAAQDELGLARDPRPLGIAIRQIVLWRGPRPTIIEADDASLSQGFHAYEPDLGHRWTDGDGIIPESLFGGGVTGVDLYVTSTTRYPLFQEAVSTAA